MKHLINILLFAVILLSGCGGSDEAVLDEHNHATMAEQYTCGMHPQIVQDGPGLCPICGMELVPLRDSGSSDGVIAIDPVTLQNIGVQVAEVRIQSLQRTVRSNGTVAVDERGQTAIAPKIGGWIEKLYVDYEGARVSRGQKLLDIYSPELVSTQEEYLLAKRNMDRLAGTGAEADAARVLEAAKRRLGYWDITDAQIRNLAETGTPTRTISLFAPSSGTVTKKSVVEGQKIQPGQTVLELADLSRIWLMIDVYEQDLSWISTGTTARIELPFDPLFSENGTIDYIYDSLNPATRTVHARIPMRNRRDLLKPGMYVVANILGKPSEALPVVPSESILRDGKSTWVIRALGDGKFLPTFVQTGLETDSLVQVISGLDEGDQVVTRAQFLIDSEARLKSSFAQMSAGVDPAETAGLKSMKVDVYAADANRDKKVFVCLDEPHKLGDTTGAADPCNGEVRSLSIGAAQSVLFYDGYKNIPVDVAWADTNKNGTVFQCPMDWAVLHDHDGNCEVCNMKLTSVSVDTAKANLRREGYRLAGGNSND